jgi:hypothetical protein
MTKKSLRISLLVVLLFTVASASQNVRSSYCDEMPQQNEIPQHQHPVNASTEEAAAGKPTNTSASGRTPYYTY